MLKLLFLLFATQLFSQNLKEPTIIILGTIQDGGSPHIVCEKDCCKNLYSEPDNTRKVACLGIIDPFINSRFLIDATPDITSQLNELNKYLPTNKIKSPSGIFLTHGHIGHYTGLMYLGKEAMSAKNVPVFVMPKMKEFLETNAPWNLLVKDKNIKLAELKNEESINLSSYLRIKPILVPHRDELSETVGYIIEGANKKALYIPDINKWQLWSNDIISLIKSVDYAFIDGTFYSENELKSRNISEIPHPLISESMNLFKSLSEKDRNKIYFIHLNHTNPALNIDSQEYKLIIENGFNIAKYLDKFSL